MSWTWRFHRWPVFAQTLALLLSSLLISQVIGMAVVFLLPAPRPDFNRISDVRAALLGQPSENEDRERVLHLRVQPVAPETPSGLTTDPQFTHDLAQRLNVADGDVRLYFQPETRYYGGGGGGPRRHRHQVMTRLHEPFFFGRLLASVRTPQGWRVAETAPRPLISPWQRNMMAWFGIGVLALMPLAWVFARAISRQIRRFADAADRLGTDPNAPPVREQGAAELRIAARALNRMQGRINEYLGERTALIGAIAHDLRTPLARIAFRVELAPEPLREKVLADVDQMQKMISATMGFMRHAAAPGERARIDLADLVAAIVEQDQDLERPVKLGKLDAAAVNGDPLALERLIQNLIDNGVAYGGEVDVSLKRAGGEAQLSVADRGPGLPPDMLERAFQPFLRGDPSRNRETGGIGLGLTIARSMAEDHGGRLTLHNRKGGGLEALLRLPLAA